MVGGLFVHSSNRLEELLEALAAVLGADPLPPLQDEIIAVPSQGIARWLRLRLAEKHGIAAGMNLPFLGAWLHDLARRAEATTDDPLAKDLLVFRLWRLLREEAVARECALATAYCSDDPDDQKRLQLCQRLARVFDDYQVWRPDVLQRWSAGDDTKELGPHAVWQARLWRHLVRDCGWQTTSDPLPTARPRGKKATPAKGALLFAEPVVEPEHRRDEPIRILQLQRLLGDETAVRLLPRRLSVFGASTLPPSFLDLLATVARHVPVHLYVPAPAWFADAEASNAWLDAFGAQSREFAALLAELDSRQMVAVHHLDLGRLAGRTPEQPARTVLQHLQQQVADLGGGNAPARHRLDPADASFRVHDCHSPLRELEVVRDQILAAFAADASLQPHDVLVLVPDIETYAPIAHAVFGPVAEHLPFHVADRSPVHDLPVCSTLFAILQLLQKRVEVHDLFRILEEPTVHRRFGLGPADLPALRDRCARAGIRWGIDADSRARTCRLPGFAENSWRTGLERLLLGVATGPMDDLVFGALPCADATSGRDEALARLLHFVDSLFAWIEPLNRPQTLANWARLLDDLMDRCFLAETPDETAALQRLRHASARLREIEASARLREPLSPRVLQLWLEESLQQSAGTRGFLAGAVTVAALQPMRTVPARCVFVCGLADATFPRRHQPLAFDLNATPRRPGDRDTRLDDRQLFLDVVMAARQQLHFCYVGHSAKDDSECAPSVVVAELLDLLDQGGTVADGRSPRQACTVRHPLQPWSTRYRDGRDARLFTFSRAVLPSAGQRGDEVPWFQGKVDPPAELDGDELALDRLLEFWKHPPRFFCKHVLGAYVRDDDDAEPTTEPFALGPLDRWRIQDQIARRAERPATDEQRRQVLRATGLLPVGGAGDVRFQELDDEAQALLGRVAAHGPRSTRPLQVTVDGLRLHGDIVGITAAQVVRHRMAKLKVKDRLGAWIVHVAVALARHAGQPDWPQTTVVLGKDGGRTLRSLTAAEARAAFGVLLRGYRDGLHMPLPFFPETSYAFAEELPNREAARKQALSEWESDTVGVYTESQDPEHVLCFRGTDPLASESFAEWAGTLFATFLPFEVDG
jgi:exodeoxyribonuclease V gamma subunit